MRLSDVCIWLYSPTILAVSSCVVLFNLDNMVGIYDHILCHETVFYAAIWIIMKGTEKALLLKLSEGPVLTFPANSSYSHSPVEQTGRFKPSRITKGTSWTSQQLLILKHCVYIGEKIITIWKTAVKERGTNCLQVRKLGLLSIFQLLLEITNSKVQRAHSFFWVECCSFRR